jgi:glucokinase
MTSQDFATIIGATAAAVALVLGAIGALYVKVHSVGEAVNGRMTELLELTRQSSRAQGRLDPHDQPE